MEFSAGCVCVRVAGWGEGVAWSCLYLCLETQRGLCPITMELRDQHVSSVCVCVCVCVSLCVCVLGGWCLQPHPDWLAKATPHCGIHWSWVTCRPATVCLQSQAKHSKPKNGLKTLDFTADFTWHWIWDEERKKIRSVGSLLFEVYSAVSTFTPVPCWVQ